MNRKLFSLAGVLVAGFGVMIGDTDADARDRAGRQCNRSCQQYGNSGAEKPGFDGLTHGKPWGEGGIFPSRHNRNTACQQSGGYMTQPYNATTGTVGNTPMPIIYATPTYAAPTVVPQPASSPTPASR